MLELPDHWLWDSWTIQDDDGRYHLFFLRASRALRDPERRHRRASIGHASSADLREWRLHADALVHSDGPAWDDLATWTGSVTRDPAGGWRLFYTGVSRAEDGLVQRIGVARSADLESWERAGMISEADSRWYEKLDSGTWYDESWRDPFVFLDDADGRWHMLITARAATGDPAGRGVVGHAVSDDLREWETLPPLTEPMGFGQVEVVQSRRVDGVPTLVFSCRRTHMAAGLRVRLPDTGTWLLPGDSLLGPWDASRLRGHPEESIYAARLVELPKGGWGVLGFVDRDDRGQFLGALGDPLPLPSPLW